MRLLPFLKPTKGVQIAGGGFPDSGGGGGSYTLPPATDTTLGGVKIGSGVNVTSDGTISVNGGSGGSWTRVATATSTGVETTAEILSTLFNQFTIDTTKTYVLCYGYLRCYATVVDSARLFFQHLVNVPTAQSSHCFQMQTNPSDCHYYYGLLAVGSPAIFTMTDNSTNLTTAGEIYNVFVLN